MKKSISNFFMYTFILAIVLMAFAMIALGLTGCGNAPTSAGEFSSDADSYATPTTLEIFTSDTGHNVNKSNILQWTNPDTSIHFYTITFDGSTSRNLPRDTKYLEVITIHNGNVNFQYVRYNDAINGHHSFAVNEPFEQLNIYIKIFI